MVDIIISISTHRETETKGNKVICPRVFNLYYWNQD